MQLQNIIDIQICFKVSIKFKEYVYDIVYVQCNKVLINKVLIGK